MEVIYLKKLKLFFIRNYWRFIRFLISLSAVSALVFSQAFSASAIEYYDCVYAKPQLTGMNCYLEIVFSSTWKWLVVAQLDAYSDATYISDIGFQAYVSGENLCIKPTTSIPPSFQLSAFRVDMSSGVMTAFSHTEVDSSRDVLQTWIGKAGTIVGIHGYNCDVTSISTATKNNFSIRYGSDTFFSAYLGYINQYLSSIDSSNKNIKSVLDTINVSLVNIFNQNKAFFGSTNMDMILKAIQDNKSSAEKKQYSGATSEQKQAQSDLASSEKKISDETAEARSTTINIFKNFSIVGDISKGLLCVTNLFNDLCLHFSPSAGLLNFSLALGIGAFLLGVSAYVVSKVIHRGGK